MVNLVRTDDDDPLRRGWQRIRPRADRGDCLEIRVWTPRCSAHPFFIRFRASRFAEPSGSPVFTKPLPGVASTDGDGVTGVLRTADRRDLHCPFFGEPSVRRSVSLRDKFAPRAQIAK